MGVRTRLMKSLRSRGILYYVWNLAFIACIVGIGLRKGITGLMMQSVFSKEKMFYQTQFARQTNVGCPPHFATVTVDRHGDGLIDVAEHFGAIDEALSRAQMHCPSDTRRPQPAGHSPVVKQNTNLQKSESGGKKAKTKVTSQLNLPDFSKMGYNGDNVLSTKNPPVNLPLAADSPVHSDPNIQYINVDILDADWANDEFRDESGATGFMLACENAQLILARSLLSRGANVNAVDKFGRNALMRSVFRGHADVCHWLIDESGIDVNAVTPALGFTALEILENSPAHGRPGMQQVFLKLTVLKTSETDITTLNSLPLG